MPEAFKNATGAGGATGAAMAAESGPDLTSARRLGAASPPSNSTDSAFKIIDDETEVWEGAAISAMKFFPHSPFCDVAVLCFSNATFEAVFEKYCMQIFDFLLLFVILCFIENHRKAFKLFSFWKRGEVRAVHQDSPQKENTMELSEQILEARPQTGPTKRRSRNHSPDQGEKAPTAQRNPAVQFVKITKKFGSFTAVDELNLNLHKDEIFCFLGHNGAGKTTSLNVLIGKEKPSKGAVLLNLEDEQYDVHDET